MKWILILWLATNLGVAIWGGPDVTFENHGGGKGTITSTTEP
jgi:hypothetical protein